MPGQTHTFKFEKKFKIKSTADLTPQLDVKLDCEFPLEGIQISMAKKIESNFNSQFEKLVKGQMAHFETWLKQKQKNIDDAKAIEKKVKKMGVPKNEAGCKKLAAELVKLANLKSGIQSLAKDFETVADYWGKNIVDQQAEIAIMMAKKKAGAKLIKDKKTRLVAGKVIRGVLLVSAIGVGVAALVLSAGTAAPAVLALGIATASLSGGAGLVGFARTVVRDNDIEKKALKNVEAEFKKISNAMAPLTNSKIGKHVLELDNIVTQRKSELKNLDMEMKKTKVLYKSQTSALRLMSGERSINELLGDKAVRKVLDACIKLDKEMEELTKKINTANNIVVQGTDLIKKLKEFDVKIEEFGKFYKSSSIGGNLKTYFTSVDGYIDLAKTLGAFRPGAGLAG